jgi:hypothetical protein
MPKEHTVRVGDDISSIAFRYGFLPGTLWDASENRPLKEKRKEDNILLPGDLVTIPDRRPKDESAGTESRHRFRRKGAETKLRLRLLDDGQLVANAKYALNVDGNTFHGSTDGDGRLEHPIVAGAKKGVLVIEETGEEYELQLGGLDPVDETSGQQQRLSNLGYSVGKIDGRLSTETRAAVAQFQLDQDLAVTGEVDQETRAKLVELHGC